MVDSTTSSSPLLKAVIIVGGPHADNEFRPLNLNCPKPLFPIAGLPMIQHHLEALSAVPGMKEVYLVGYYEANQFTSFLESVQPRYSFSIK